MNKRAITNLRIERIKKDKTQRQVANHIGVSQQYLTMIELLQTEPSKQRIKQLEEYFNKDIDYLLSIAE